MRMLSKKKSKKLGFFRSLIQRGPPTMIMTHLVAVLGDLSGFHPGHNNRENDEISPILPLRILIPGKPFMRHYQDLGMSLHTNQ
jgi:hypothetical protein